jgi:hypothetical protein
VSEQGTWFASAEECFFEVVSFLEGDEAASLDHGELEECLQEKSREVFRRLYQGHLELRALREQRVEELSDAQAAPRPYIEKGHARSLRVVFGGVEVSRFAYRAKGKENLYPADAWLNMPEERYSHGLRRIACIEAARGSYDSAVDALFRATGQKVPKRQFEELVRRGATDVEEFYASRKTEPTAKDDVVVLSCDGKGIVMRPDSLREPTRRAAEAASAKERTRLSRDDKSARKRMATIGAVYEVEPCPRSATDIFPTGPADQPSDAPEAKNKWLTASVAGTAAQVISEVFDEAERRDPAHKRTWVALVDGNNHQIDRIEAEARQRGLEVTVVVDFVHVMEYLWGSARSFFAESDPAAETWVRDRAMAVLDGKAKDVAAGIRRRAATEGLPASDRKGADECATYLANKAGYLNYPKALSSGWPIATGVIEGAVRHVCKDRMDVTGARWSVDGAEAVLKLRALRSNSDFDAYWTWHRSRERERIHAARYHENVIPAAA